MTRIEEYLVAIIEGLGGTQTSYPPEPVWHEEAFYDAILSYIFEDEDHPRKACPVPSWRSELFLKAFYDALTDPDHATCPTPVNRIEEFWYSIFDAIVGDGSAVCPEPVWRDEELLAVLHEVFVSE